MAAAAVLMSSQSTSRMQANVSSASEQPTAETTVFQFVSGTPGALTGKLNALPECRIKPETMGSDRWA